jgi:DNA-directed RNA polymerase subunit RPC12/RpoP
MRPLCPDCGSAILFAGHSHIGKIKQKNCCEISLPKSVPTYICKDCKSIFDRKPTKKRYKSISWSSTVSRDRKNAQNGKGGEQ